MLATKVYMLTLREFNQLNTASKQPYDDDSMSTIFSVYLLESLTVSSYKRGILTCRIILWLWILPSL